MSHNGNKSRARPGVRKAAIVFAIAAAASLVSTASKAVTEEQKRACMPDVLRLCFTSLGDNNAIVSCMTKNKDRISQRCKQTLPPI
jgi:hypothetical protein